MAALRGAPSDTPAGDGGRRVTPLAERCPPRAPRQGMASNVKWTNEEWRRLQTSLFAVTGTTRIRLSELTPAQWDQVVRETRRSREDIDAALDAMLRRQELPGGRVPVQTTERLFRESVTVLRKLLDSQAEDLGAVSAERVDSILQAIEGFNFATLPYEDLFLIWNCVGKSEGLMEHHESIRCVYSVLGQVRFCLPALLPAGRHRPGGSRVHAWDGRLVQRSSDSGPNRRLFVPPPDLVNPHADHAYARAAHGRGAAEAAPKRARAAPPDKPAVKAAGAKAASEHGRSRIQPGARRPRSQPQRTAARLVRRPASTWPGTRGASLDNAGGAGRQRIRGCSRQHRRPWLQQASLGQERGHLGKWRRLGRECNAHARQTQGRGRRRPSLARARRPFWASAARRARRTPWRPHPSYLWSLHERLPLQPCSDVGV